MIFLVTKLDLKTSKYTKLYNENSCLVIEGCWVGCR